MTTISMQVGVDILGFPIYRVFTPKKVVKAQSKFKETDKKFETETIYYITTITQR